MLFNKQVFCIILFHFLLSIGLSTAQTNTFPTSGNVGIGTVDPQAKLHLNGSIRGAGNGQLEILTDYGYLKLGPGHSTWAHLLTDRSKFYLNKPLVIGGGRYISSYQDQPLSLRTSSGSNEVLKLLPNGNVGIGIGTPLAKLHINGSIRGSGPGGQLHIQTDYGYLRMGSVENGTTQLLTDQDQFLLNKPILVGGTERYISATGTRALSLRTSNGNNEVMTLYNSGRVAVGGVSPKEQLHVDGAIVIKNSINATPGTIRYRNGDFQGRTNQGWVSLTAPAQNSVVWVPAVEHSGVSSGSSPNPCALSCNQAGGLIPAADQYGNICKTSGGGKGKFTSFQGAYPNYYYACGGSALLAQCRCLLPNGSNNLAMDDSQEQGQVLILEADNPDFQQPFSATSETEIPSLHDQPLLRQNSPNPFLGSTRVDVIIPDDLEGMVELVVENALQTQTQRIQLAERGAVSVDLNLADLPAGMYYYSLVVDAELIDTRTMVKAN